MTTPLLVFDLDGTLLETAPDLVGTLNGILAGEGLQPIPYETAKTYIGQGAKMLLEKGFAANNQQLEGDRADELFSLFLTSYEARIAQESHPFPGLLEALDQLAQEGWTFAVCTNKLEHLARMLLDELELSSRFIAITGDFGYTPVPVSELGPDLVISEFSQIHAAIRSIRLR